MPQRVRCHCHGNPDCKLCKGEKFYYYEPGPRGWIPFRCPTCQGAQYLPDDRGGTVLCYTCAGGGNVDPATPPVAPGWWGALRVGWKTFFGGG